jgi:hypothetical protein
MHRGQAQSRAHPPGITRHYGKVLTPTSITPATYGAGNVVSSIAGDCHADAAAVQSGPWLALPAFKMRAVRSRLASSFDQTNIFHQTRLVVHHAVIITQAEDQMYNSDLENRTTVRPEAKGPPNNSSGSA